MKCSILNFYYIKKILTYPLFFKLCWQKPIKYVDNIYIIMGGSYGIRFLLLVRDVKDCTVLRNAVNRNAVVLFDIY
jgi:hypothetical protein